ncbi:MAG: hypothetical protein OXS29_17255 [bacterium]|nr:hypothetical protein [bacterium]MDE0287172.1 hypothetical protein [bacterium]MDE0437515.1 hypothetical protein [bacterium]
MADLDYDATIALLNDPDVPLDDVGVPAPPERWTQIAELADRMFYESPLGTQVEHICDVATDRAVRLLAGMPPDRRAVLLSRLPTHQAAELTARLPAAV